MWVVCWKNTSSFQHCWTAWNRLKIPFPNSQPLDAQFLELCWRCVPPHALSKTWQLTTTKMVQPVFLHRSDSCRRNDSLDLRDNPSAIKSRKSLSCTEKKKESQNGSPRGAIWLSVTQLSLELHFCATLHRRAVSEQKKGPIWLSMLKDSRFVWGKKRLSYKK